MNYNGLSDGRGGSVGASFPTNNSKLKPGTKGIPTKEYDRSQLSKKELSDNYVATVTDVMNEVFVVEGGTCECNKGIDPAKIKNTQSASTSFGGKKALTVSCVKMEGEIFGACKKLTEENDKKKGKKCPPIMCKGKFKPVPDKWLDPVASVSSNGEEVIAVYSKLKCEHGGTIHITRNGQGGLYDQGYVNFEVSKEFAWAFTPFAASGYQLYTGRNMNDWSVMTKTETGIQVVCFILDGVTVFSVGKKMVSAASKGNKYEIHNNLLKMDLQLFAKKNDIKQIESIAKKFNMDPVKRREFGDYIESLKDLVPNNKNFSWKELEKLAKEFMEDY